MENNYDKAVEIAPDIFWVGFYDPLANFHCNPYLIVVKGEGILIDPGSIPDFPKVAFKLSSVLGFNKIKYIVISHQDPDLASSIPVFEKVINNKDLRIITTERVSFLTHYYGFNTPYRLVEEGPLVFNGRRFEFMRTPYLHAPGAFITYDPRNKVMFSSDIFGAFSEEWDLYADKKYPQKMYSFHHNYMPPGKVLANQIKKFEKLDLELIAPQHGSIIKKELIPACFKALKTMKVGGYLDE